MRRLLMAGIASAALLGWPMLQAVSAQGAPSPAAARPAVDSRAAVAEIRKVLAENYVLRDKRPALDAALAKGLADGRYDVTDPVVLAERVSADLDAVAHDKHLGVEYDPEQAAQLAGHERTDDGPPAPEQMLLAERRNHGLVEMKLLPGNIRYLDLRGFMWVGDKSARAYDDAMRFLRGGDAVIIDLRNNGGGSPSAVRYAISHFIEPNRPIVTFHMGSEAPDPWSSLPSVPAGRMVGKPLYVLTSGRTASAAEEFAGHVGGYRLGALVGQTTAGAGFRNSFFPLPGGLVMSVSVGRAVLASTGKDWEGVGIVPTIASDPAKALEVARMHAMRRLAATAAPRQKAELEAMAAMLGAQVEPVPTALPLTAYAGAFGERTLRVEAGKLTWQRGDGPKLVMLPIGPNLFTFEDDPLSRIEYVVEGNAARSLLLIRGDGSRETIARTS